MSTPSESPYIHDEELRLLGDPDLALGVMELVFSTPEWVHRRKEQAEIVTAEHFRRHVTLDFTVPRPCRASLTWPDESRIMVVPIDVLAKKPLPGFDIWDEHGEVVPVLTMRQNSTVAWKGMVAYADQVLKSAELGEPPEWVTKGLRRITQSKPVRAEKVLHTASQAATLGNNILDALLADEAFVQAAEMLAENFLLLASLPCTPGARRILKFAFEEPFSSPATSEQRPPTQRISESLGMKPTTFSIKVPSFSDCESYHFEAVAPTGVEFVDIVLGDESRVSSEGSVDPRWQLGYSFVLRESPHRAHLVCGRTSHEDSPLDEFVDPMVSVRVQVERFGWLRSSAIAATLIAAFMVLTYRYTDDLNRRQVAALNCRSSVESAVSVSDGAAQPPDAVLVCQDVDGSSTDPAAFTAALVGVASLAVMRPGEHAYTARMLRSLRIVAVLAALVPLAAAWMIVFPSAGPGLVAVWVVLTATAALCAVLLLFALMRPAALRSKR